LKSPQATAATIAIIEAFAKLRELSHTIAKLAEAKEKPEQQSLIDERVSTSKSFSPLCKEAEMFFLN
jgi:hypothetical protein